MKSTEPAKSGNIPDDRYRLLVQNVRDYAIFLLDPTGIIQTWNAGAENLKGFEAQEVIGRHFSLFYTPEDIAREHPLYELEVATRDGRYEEEGWRVRKDGNRFWANIVITRLNDENGRHIGFAKVTRDLTERRQAEQALRESEERFRLIVDSVRDYAIIMLNPSGQITSWNEGARRLSGYEAEEILGHHFSKFYVEDEVAGGKCEYELREANATGRFEDEGWRLRKDGTHYWANVILTPLRSPRGELRGFAKVTRDMTERKHNEDKLRMAHESLEKRVQERTLELKQAVEARDEFLSIASHELRTPLTALRLQQQLFRRYVERLGTEVVPANKALEVTTVTERQLTQLTRLVEDMLDVSRIATGRFRLVTEPTDVSSLMQRVYESFRAQFIASGVQAELRIEENLHAELDGQRIEQVLVNLISNAIRYGGRAPITIEARRKGDRLEFSVRDRGPGIPDSEQSRIFERFERAVSANEVSGLGLGLYISRQIVEAHGGTIHVESAPGKGAKFIFTI